MTIVTERAETAKRAEVPNYVTDTGYVEDIAARMKVGDAQDMRLLAVMNVESGKTVTADAAFGTACTQSCSPAGWKETDPSI